jgi:hypothetical protein
MGQVVSKVSVILQRQDGHLHACVEVHDHELLGHDAELSMLLRARVKDSRPVHASRTLWEHRFRLDAVSIDLLIPDDCLAGCYVYTGSKLDVLLESRLKVDDALLFDTSVDSDHSGLLGPQPRACTGDVKQLEPADAFSLTANLAAIPLRNRIIAIALIVCGGLLVLGNVLLGLHDEFTPEAQTLFYDHRGSDGSESPLMKALMGSGVLGAAVWFALRAQLRRYMRFVLKQHPPLRRGLRLPLSELVEAESRVPLKGACIRVVAGNREKGQYRRKSKDKDETRSFCTAVSAIVVFERTFNLLPARVPLATYFGDVVEFDRLFDALLPPLPIGSSHGIDVVWEVQLLHAEFVDQELAGGCDGLRYQDFLAPAAADGAGSARV